MSRIPFISSIKDSIVRRCFEAVEDRIRVLEQQQSLTVADGDIILEAGDIGLKVFVQSTRPNTTGLPLAYWISTASTPHVVYQEMRITGGTRDWVYLVGAP